MADRQCDLCGNVFSKRSRESWAQWRARRFCSRQCSGASHRLQDFWSYVDKSSGYCWLWAGPKDTSGYGMYSQVRAHRYAYEQAHGTIAPGLNVCHHCDTPACVRPEHLFAATQFGNVLDCMRKGRRATKLTIDEVLAIRRRHAEGEKQVALAEMYQVSAATICNIVNGNTWRYPEAWRAGLVYIEVRS